MKISIIIPTYNRSEQLKKCLLAIENQSFEKSAFEVIVVNDGSSDDTKSILDLFKSKTKLNLRIINKGNGGPSAARNAGIDIAKGEFLAFTDDDCVPQKDWLKDLYENFPDDEQCAGIGGLILGLNNTLLSKYIDEFIKYEHLEIDGRILYLVTANAMYRRKNVLEIGGFNDKYKWPGGEDPELSWRIINKGYYLKSLDGALILHNHRDSFSGIYKTLKYYGKGMSAGHQLGMITTFEPSFRFFLREIYQKSKRVLARKEDKFTHKLVFLYAEFIATLGVFKGFKSCPNMKQN